MDCIVHGILRARILEWIAIPFFRGSSGPRNRTGVSCIAEKKAKQTRCLFSEDFQHRMEETDNIEPVNQSTGL